MDISQVAKQTGIAASALRYYEKKGLIRSRGRNGIRRDFGVEVIEQLALISLGRAGGLSLEEIRSMLCPQGGANINRALLASKAKEIDGRIKQLRAISRSLRHAAACPARKHADCPTFQRMLKAAASGALNKTSFGSRGPRFLAHSTLRAP